MVIVCETIRRPMACFRCASKCETIYDRRKVRIRDDKIRNFHVRLIILKKRYLCPSCKKPRTESIDGVLPKCRTTQRFKRAIKKLCLQFSSLEDVCKEFKVSRDFVYRAFYEMLELETRKHQNPWPEAIGVDEHSFRKPKGGGYGRTEFATLIVSHTRKKAIDLVNGKTCLDLHSQLSYIPGRENVRWVTLDLCDPFKKWAKEFFPNAKLVADPFHVIRLLNADLIKTRKEITGDIRTLKVRKLIMRSRIRLEYFERTELDQFLGYHPKLEEIYYWKEKLLTLYRTRGYEKAKVSLKSMIDEMASSRSKPILRLRKTLQKWFNEVLGHFQSGLTNARVEGFNNVAKTVLKRAYGFRSFKNFKLKVLNACY
jgi:transposase